MLFKAKPMPWRDKNLQPQNDSVLQAILEGRGDQLPLSAAAKRRIIEDAVESNPSRIQELDEALWRVRAQEQAEEGVPVTVGELKRTRLIESDRISTTWDSWELATGKRHALRVLRPVFRKDPVWRRRLARGIRLAREVEGIIAVNAETDGEWPTLSVPINGLTLADLLPAEDYPDSQQLAAFLIGGLKGLHGLYAKGLHHGHLDPHKLVLTPKGVQLAWLDPFLETRGSVQKDLSNLGAAVAQLDPTVSDPIGAVAHSWADEPPPNLEMAQDLLLRSMGTRLAENRYHLLMRSRYINARSGEARLLRAVRALKSSLAPPKATVCLRAGKDSVLVVAECDGKNVHGGGLAALPMRHLPEIWSSERGLDASASRMLLRSFATRRSGDEARRAEIQKELGGTDVQADQLCRWLSAQARLRAATKLLELSRKPI